MQDRPTASELLDAVRGFVERDVVPALDGTAKFHARVAANVLAIVARELALEDGHVEAEWLRLDDVLEPAILPADPAERRAALRARTETLCARIRDGDADADPFRAAVLAHLTATVREKLAIANPKLLSR
ncbi:hypothetical protein KF840_12280 [bacterium]|nr:hypothetical protein [bacterium]